MISVGTQVAQPWLAGTLENACTWLLGEQDPSGYWVGRLQTNSCMEAEWVLAQHVLGVERDSRFAGVVQAILNEQRDDGSWDVYHGAPVGDVNATVECYAALRSAGLDVNCPELVRARAWIFEHRALERIRVFTRYWLALIGEWSWTDTPDLPPEIIFLPRRAPFSLYQFASWARATMVPLAILSARRFCRPLDDDCRLDELFPAGREEFDYSLPARPGLLTGAFRLLDSLLRRYTSFPVQPGRETAIRCCLEWLLKHQEADGAWSGIQPPWIYSLLALRCEGYPLSHPALAAGLEAFNQHWRIDEGEAIYLQASESPVWDTLLSALGLIEAGHTADETPEVARAVDWVLAKQNDYSGDWHLSTPVPPGGWAFERANLFYPDVDDTSVAVILLARLRETSEYRRAEVDLAIDRAVQWMLAMQSSNGGWAAFDRDNNSALVAAIPFSDFGETLDPPSVDVTAHVVESLGLLGWRDTQPEVQRALDYIYAEQEEDGSWFGRWGVNYIYGTWSVLVALQAIGQNMKSAEVRRAVAWLLAHQNDDGGWGESCRSYMDPAWRGRGNSTASQTAWAMMGLLAATETGGGKAGQQLVTNDGDEVDADEVAVLRAVSRGGAWLARTQQDGTWNEPEYTGTGFPGYGIGERVDLAAAGQTLDQGAELSRGFMLNYHLYRHYFPVMALARLARRNGTPAGGIRAAVVELARAG